MQNLLFDELCIKRLKKSFLIFAIACVGFISVIYTPVYLLLASNVLWRGSLLLFLWTELMGPLVDFSFYWGSFAFLIYIYLRFGKKQIKYFAIVAALSIAARYVITLIVNFALMSFPGWEMIWQEELPSALFGILMDALQMLGVLLLAEFCCRRPLMQAKAYTKGSEGEEMIGDCLPITSFFNIKQPLNKLCFFAALIPAGIKLLSRLYYDIFFWGLPTDASEWLLVVTYYIGDVASFLVGYFVLLYLLQTIFANETKRKIEFES